MADQDNRSSPLSGLHPGGILGGMYGNAGASPQGGGGISWAGGVGLPASNQLPMIAANMVSGLMGKGGNVPYYALSPAYRYGLHVPPQGYTGKMYGDYALGADIYPAFNYPQFQQLNPTLKYPGQ